MTRRVILGQQNDGTYGLRVSAPGVDAFVGSGQGGDFTFNSDWTDTADLHQIGVLSYAASGVKTYDAGGNVLFNSGYGTLFTNIGYRPFIEVRRFTTSNVVYDDYWEAANTAGVGGSAIFRDCFRCPSASSTDKVFYVVYKIPAPQQGAGF